ncbi:putative protein kinase RLK-Pelle-CrRLK1L-1 family [Helianthus annuus]|nr:putative protein kinase RLK-Pelle-CrRLK1L-1 family [Helianthus annuus]KAJ0655442.1 putative protein kinase RLK-Pelle-CrRLK1L-1 family [Helianthus annuus]
MPLIEKLKHLRIPYEDIQAATKNFTTLIGSGGYGPVYKGQLSLAGGELITVAAKRLQNNNLSGQGLKEFLTEIQMLSRYKHPNIVSLVGFCEEGNEKFLVYEYAENGSLNNYLKPTKSRCPLTWRQRINICVDAARGLAHLHHHVATNQRVIHRDIKSANILLCHNMKAMIADFGLSKIGRANETITYIITNASGTFGYCDPAYINSGILTKESDIYSFGVVLFEVLCGRLCFKNVNGEEEPLAELAKRYYIEGKLDLIIDHELKNYMNSDSMKEFSEIAFHCLADIRSERPPMSLVLQRLEKSLKFLEIEEGPELLFHEIGGLRIDSDVMKAIYDMPDSLLFNITRDKIYSHLTNGIIVDKGKVWISIDDNGKTQEMISAIKFVPLDGDGCRTRSESESRFHTVVEVSLPIYYMKVKISTQFLSSHVAYAAYLVCKPNSLDAMEQCAQNKISYKLNDICKSYTSYRSMTVDSGWWMYELFETINLERTAEFVVTLQILDNIFCSSSHLLIEGIKFLPIQKFEDDVGKSEVDKLSTSNIKWDMRLPSDYEQFIYYSKKRLGDVIFPTKAEAYSILSTGVLIQVNDEVNIWFWITKLNGKKCFVLPPTLLSYDKKPLRKIKSIPSEKSRHGNILRVSSSKVIGMCFKVPNGLLSRNTRYGCYLIYMTPQVIGADGECRSTRPINNLKNVQLPRKRKDGWMELTVMNIQEDEWFGHLSSREKSRWNSCFLPCITHNDSRNKADNVMDDSFTLDPRYFSNITLHMCSSDMITLIPELIVQGIEFRPL